MRPPMQALIGAARAQATVAALVDEEGWAADRVLEEPATGHAQQLR